MCFVEVVQQAKQGSGIEMLVLLAVVQVGRNYESWAEKPGVEKRGRWTKPCSWLQLSPVLTCVDLGEEDRRKANRPEGQERRWNERQVQIQMGDARRGNMRDRAAVRW